MTLIVTVICNQGIIQASDSHLTYPSGRVESGPKVFKLGFADGVLALAGAYHVGAKTMDRWLPDLISSYSSSAGPTLRGFANHLAVELECSPTSSAGRIFHISGYVSDASGVHPEFYFVRNFHGIDAMTGDYEPATSEYQVTEDFWTRDYLRAPEGTFATGGYQRYFNGTPPGRIAYFGAVQKLQEFYAQVWGESDWKFRKPVSLDELAAFVRLELETISALYMSSDYPSPYIGGEIQIVKIPAPSEAITL
ncbi:hypothetical protein ACIPN8_25050 [Streptomyces sp. NPDC086082]|uniref:hypothetical protein n=1 Tax=Streptomyces sp. NPDC086082 TaxID=3365750 RepID=UPI00380A14C0